jgi:hypothetical protein
MANCSYDTTGFKDVPCEILNFSGFGKIPHGAMTTGKDNGPVITRIYMKVTRRGQDKNDMESSLLLNLMNLENIDVECYKLRTADANNQEYIFH